MSSHENDSTKVVCDGGDLASKHPLVYLKINESGSATCPYCGKKISKESSKKHD